MSAAEYKNHRLLIGLLGAPIRHSASPAMHEAAADALGWRGFYQLIEIENANSALLRQLLAGVRSFGFAGINVTYPYKTAVVPLLDDLSEEARLVGAVNTVVVKHGRLVGHNTDASGFARSVAEMLASSFGPVAVIGAGGVGKAASVAMARLGVQGLRIFDLDRHKAAALARIVGPMTKSCASETAAEALSGASGLVNATPIGMLPNRDSPIDLTLLRPDLWVADVIYYPLWTPLLREARRVGAPVLTGRALAIHQAVDAFRLFTGVEPSIDVMAAAFDAAMVSLDGNSAPT
jgi:shikimate dehydrogenase